MECVAPPSGYFTPTPSCVFYDAQMTSDVRLAARKAVTLERSHVRNLANDSFKMDAFEANEHLGDIC